MPFYWCDQTKTARVDIKMRLPDRRFPYLPVKKSFRAHNPDNSRDVQSMFRNVSTIGRRSINSAGNILALSVSEQLCFSVPRLTASFFTLPGRFTHCASNNNRNSCP